MNLETFEKSKQLENNLYVAREGHTEYVRAVNQNHPAFRLPDNLKTFSDIHYWEVGIRGRRLWIGNLEVL